MKEPNTIMCKVIQELPEYDNTSYHAQSIQGISYVDLFLSMDWHKVRDKDVCGLSPTYKF